MIATAILLVGLLGCGGGDGDSTRSSTEHVDAGAFARISEDKNGQIKIVPSNEPAPKTMLVRDIKVGSGPVARRGDQVAVHYRSVAYDSGRMVSNTWPPSRPLIMARLGFEGWGESWEEGIEGMRVGGRRELVIPKRLTGQGSTLDYVVDLEGVKSAG